MLVQAGDGVRSLKGRDEGRLMIVVGRAGTGDLLLCDGRLRRIESPKRKREKHVAWISRPEGAVCEKLRHGEKVTNAEIRIAIAGLRQSEGGEETYGQG